MASNTKCPSCGVENGPCLIDNGMPKYHVERLKAANPTTYEFPDCAECRKLKDSMVSAQYDVRSFRPPDPGKSRSRWPQGYRDELYRIECHANETKAKYELHLVNAHGDKTYEHSVTTNLTILLREGRLKP
jgi:hypothetical protein